LYGFITQEAENVCSIIQEDENILFHSTGGMKIYGFIPVVQGDKNVCHWDLQISCIRVIK
jgi:hypothetical protein